MAQGIEFRKAHFPGRAPIEAYGNGGFRFASMSHRGSILCLPSGIYGWDMTAEDALTPEHFQKVLDEAAEIEFLLVGTGVDMRPLPQVLKAAFRAAKISSDPMNTQTTAQTKGVAFPAFLAQFRERERTLDPSRQPLATVVADGAGQALVQHAGMLVPVEGREGKNAFPVDQPMRTQSTRNETAIVIPLRNHGVAKPVASPIDTVSANGNHHALVMRNNTGGAEMSTPVTEELRTLTTGGHQSLLVPYYSASEFAKPTSDPHGTLTTGDRYGLVESEISLDVDDVLFRMLTPDEIKVGMAFAPDYYLGGTKREQVKQAGNAVTPPAARDLGMAVAEALNGVELERAS